MRHEEEIAQRMMNLGGDPNSQELMKQLTDVMNRLHAAALKNDTASYGRLTQQMMRVLGADPAKDSVLAYTECTFRGPPRVVIRPDLSAADSLPVRVHEEVHAAQCRALGPVRYRLRNLTGSGKLSLEVPAYCAAAQVRLKATGHWEAVRAHA